MTLSGVSEWKIAGVVYTISSSFFLDLSLQLLMTGYLNSIVRYTPFKKEGKKKEGHPSPITLNYRKLKVWSEIQSTWIDAFTLEKNCVSKEEKGKKSILAINSPCNPWREKRHLEF